MTAIWDNAAFVALSEPAQRAYLLLITQPDISAAGVLRMWVPRWAEMSATSSTDDFTHALKELEANRFVVLDLTAGELLIRSFIKWDAGYNNVKRKPVIRRAREEVRSGRIREYLDVDFVRFGLDDPPPGGGGIGVQPDSHPRSTDENVDSPSDSLSGPRAPDPAESAFAHVDSPSDRTPTWEGVVVTSVSTGEPQPSTPEPSEADASGRALAAVHHDPPTIDAGMITGAWADAFTATGARPTKHQKGQVGREAKQLLDAGNDAELVLDLAQLAGTKRRQNLIAELAMAAPKRPSPQQARTSVAVDCLPDAFAEYERRHGNVHPLPRRGA